MFPGLEDKEGEEKQANNEVGSVLALSAPRLLVYQGPQKELHRGAGGHEQGPPPQSRCANKRPGCFKLRQLGHRNKQVGSTRREAGARGPHDMRWSYWRDNLALRSPPASDSLVSPPVFGSYFRIITPNEFVYPYCPLEHWRAVRLRKKPHTLIILPGFDWCLVYFLPFFCVCMAGQVLFSPFFCLFHYLKALCNGSLEEQVMGLISH